MNNCNCEGNIYNIGMGCCKPVVVNADLYYTKEEVDDKIEEIVISGGGITEEECQEMIDASISTIDEAYKAADSVISGAVDNVSTNLQTEVQRAQNAESALDNKVDAFGQYVDANFAEKDELEAATGNLSTQIQAIQTELDNDYATEDWVSGYTYDKQTIEDMIEEGGGFVPENYYDKTATDALLNEKLDVTAYTPTDLSNYYQKSETSGATEIANALNDKASTSAVTEVASDLATLSGEVQTISGESVTTGEVQTQIDAAVSGKADTSAVTQVNNALTAHTANTTAHVTAAEKSTWNNKSDFSGDYNDLTNKPIIPVVWQGTKAEYEALTTKDSATIYLIYEE